MRLTIPWTVSSLFHAAFAACLAVFPLSIWWEEQVPLTAARYGGVVTLQLASSPATSEPAEVTVLPRADELEPTVKIARQTSEPTPPPPPSPDQPVPEPSTPPTRTERQPEPAPPVDDPVPPTWTARAPTAELSPELALELPLAAEVDDDVFEPATVQLARTQPETSVSAPVTSVPPPDMPADVEPTSAPAQRRPASEPASGEPTSLAPLTSAARHVADVRPTTFHVTVLPTASQQGNSVDRLPRSLSGNLEPLYPAEMRARLQEGDVVLLVSISQSGAVTDLSVAQSSGFNSFDDAALAAVRRWRFAPAQRNGRNVSYLVRVPIQFRIR